MNKKDVAELLITKIENIVKLKKDGYTIKKIAQDLEMTPKTVSKWYKRFKDGETAASIAVSSVKTNPQVWGLPSINSGQITKNESLKQDASLETLLDHVVSSPTSKILDDDEDNVEDDISEFETIIERTSEQIKELVEDDEFLNDETKKEVIKLITNNQKTKDKLRIERTMFRSTTRAMNAWDEYFIDLQNVFKSQQLSLPQVPHKSKTHTKSCGVIHFSDLHFNEEIDLKNNKFNFDIASKRIQKHVDHCLKFFNAYDIVEVVIAFTGDILNSDRRLDELLMNSTNRAKATFMAVDILKGAIEEVSQFYNVRVATITGNESRVGKDVGWVNGIAQDNFDYIINEILSYTFSNNQRVEFLKPDDTFLEKVVDVAGQNLLLLHGHNGFAHNTEQKFASKIGQYATRGTVIDYIIYGHLHASHISDMFARSSGLPGSNNYSQNALNLTGRSSQNFYIFTDSGDRHGMKVDLQNVNGYDGYDYQKV